MAGKCELKIFGKRKMLSYSAWVYYNVPDKNIYKYMWY